MAGRTWQELIGAPAATPAPAHASAPAPRREAVVADRAGRSSRPGASPASPDQAALASPRLAQLIAEREALTARMHTLASGGDALAPRDAARFQVPSFAERRAEFRALEARLDAQRERISEPPARPAADRPGTPNAERTPREPGLPSRTRPRSPDRFATPTASAQEFLARRDRDRMALRDAARDRLAPLTAVADAGRSLGTAIGGTQGKLRDLDSRLAAEGVSAEERADIQRELGSDRLKAIDDTVGSVNRTLDAPSRAIDRIDSAWTGRRDRIEGALDRIGPYAETRERRLGLDTGGSGDLFERMRRNREQALQRRREARAESAADDHRRNQATARRRQRESERR